MILHVRKEIQEYDVEQKTGAYIQHLKRCKKFRTIECPQLGKRNCGYGIDGNQEFIGQGLANIVTGFFSGYPGGGSLSCSAINAEAGARTPVAAILSGVFTLIGMVVLAALFLGTMWFMAIRYSWQLPIAQSLKQPAGESEAPRDGKDNPCRQLKK